MQSTSDILKKINKITHEEPPEIAVHRLLGYMKAYFWMDELRNHLAQLYYQQGDYILAGRYWYLKERKTETELGCIQQYVWSKGQNLIMIAREQIGENFRSPQKLSKHVKRQLFTLLTQIEEQYGYIPKFGQNWYRHFQKEVAT